MIAYLKNSQKIIHKNSMKLDTKHINPPAIDNYLSLERKKWKEILDHKEKKITGASDNIQISIKMHAFVHTP